MKKIKEKEEELKLVNEKFNQKFEEESDDSSSDDIKGSNKLS